MPNLDLQTTLAWLFGVGACLIVLATTLPHLLPALGFDDFRTGASGGPEDLDPAAKGEQYEHLYRQLLALGFEPMGLTWEKVAAKPRIVSCAFLLRREHCRASVSRLLGGDYRVLLVSRFTDGTEVLTTNYSRPNQETADFLAKGVPATDLAVVLDEHRRSIAYFVTQQRQLEPCANLEDIVAAKRAYHFNPTVRSQYRQNTGSTFRKLIFFVGRRPVWLILLLGLNMTDFPPVIVCGLAFLTSILQAISWQVNRHAHLQQLTREQQSADAARKR